MFSNMTLRMTLTHFGDVISNTLILDDEHEIELPNVTINEDEVLEYEGINYELNYIRDVFNNGNGNHVYYYSLTPVEIPITRLILDNYIGAYFYE